MTRMHGVRRLRCGMRCGMMCSRMMRCRMMGSGMMRRGVMRGGVMGRAVMRASRVPVAAVGKARRLSQKSPTHHRGQSDQLQALHFHLPFGYRLASTSPVVPKVECGICPQSAKNCETQHPKSS